MIQILWQEKDWLAVDKPIGLSVHNEEDSTNLLKELSKQLQLTKLFPVHRLDKETSGIQILALTDTKAAEWADHFQKRNIRKFYQGIVAGQMPQEGQWATPLSDQAEGWKNPAGKTQDQRPCETRFRLMKSSQYFSWLEFEIFTGRQHQIRKHCALAGHALIGDPRYGNPKYNAKIAELYKFQRMALHCSEIQIPQITLKAEPPSEFSRLFPETA